MPKAVFVDVDGTLELRGMQLNRPLIDKIKTMRNNGYEVCLWRSRGKEHAEQVAAKHGVTELFDSIISKPGVIIDDAGWSWTAFVSQQRSGLM